MQTGNEKTVTVRLPEADKNALISLCKAEDVTPSQVVRRLIRQHLKQHKSQLQTPTNSLS